MLLRESERSVCWVEGESLSHSNPTLSVISGLTLGGVCKWIRQLFLVLMWRTGALLCPGAGEQFSGRERRRGSCSRGTQADLGGVLASLRRCHRLEGKVDDWQVVWEVLWHPLWALLLGLCGRAQGARVWQPGCRSVSGPWVTALVLLSCLSPC